MGEFFTQLVAVDWAGLIGAAVASGVGLSFVTQLLKAKFIVVPAKRYPRAVSAVLALLVGFVSTVAVGLELSSLASLVVFSIVAFVTSGIAYDVVKRLVAEIKQEEPVTALGKVSVDVLAVDHITAGSSDVKLESPKVNTAKPDDRLTVSQVAQQIIDGAGDWGNGAQRKATVTEAGYDYEEVQAEVKRLVAK